MSIGQSVKVGKEECALQLRWSDEMLPSGVLGGGEEILALLQSKPLAISSLPFFLLVFHDGVYLQSYLDIASILLPAHELHYRALLLSVRSGRGRWQALPRARDGGILFTEQPSIFGQGMQWTLRRARCCAVRCGHAVYDLHTSLTCLSSSTNPAIPKILSTSHTSPHGCTSRRACRPSCSP